jgi:hypothetical protein
MLVYSYPDILESRGSSTAVTTGSRFHPGRDRLRRDKVALQSKLVDSMQLRWHRAGEKDAFRRLAKRRRYRVKGGPDLWDSGLCGGVCNAYAGEACDSWLEEYSLISTCSHGYLGLGLVRICLW